MELSTINILDEGVNSGWLFLTNQTHIVKTEFLLNFLAILDSDQSGFSLGFYKILVAKQVWYLITSLCLNKIIGIALIVKQLGISSTDNTNNDVLWHCTA